uniref:Uncharacterized protein n=1 Tax=Arundo donax TaxID=35708 RepID=A0A0A9CSD2_ARUDO
MLYSLTRFPLSYTQVKLVISNSICSCIVMP